MRSSLQKSNFLFVIGFIFAVSFVFSAQVTFAYNPLHIHHVVKSHVSKHAYTHPILGVLSATDTSYSDELYFNEDDEHENGKSLNNDIDNNFVRLNSKSLENVENITEGLFAKQVHVNYLLEENSSQKVTTSQ